MERLIPPQLSQLFSSLYQTLQLSSTLILFALGGRFANAMAYLRFLRRPLKC